MGTQYADGEACRHAYAAIGPNGKVVASANIPERAKERAQIKGVQAPLIVRVARCGKISDSISPNTQARTLPPDNTYK